MPSNLNLDYYYGTEADQYSFYRIPKTLLTDPRYKSVSIEAKVLYGLLLDRMSLSVKNNWMDIEKRIYIYFTLENVMYMMDCGHNKAVKLFAELDSTGLIERVKQGQGRPTRIYVK
ncbi:MAG: replication initiator protein A, partial [Oscillospiraceae bacterium]|nr:replication initiator protein A [Oscillospiraceae bacterium]